MEGNLIEEGGPLEDDISINNEVLSNEVIDEKGYVEAPSRQMTTGTMRLSQEARILC